MDILLSSPSPWQPRSTFVRRRGFDPPPSAWQPRTAFVRRIGVPSPPNQCNHGRFLCGGDPWLDPIERATDEFAGSSVRPPTLPFDTPGTTQPAKVTFYEL